MSEMWKAVYAEAAKILRDKFRIGIDITDSQILDKYRDNKIEYWDALIKAEELVLSSRDWENGNEEH